MEINTENSNTVIKNVEAKVYSYNYKKVALSFGVGNMVKRDLVLVKITCEDGTVGYGEAHHALSPTAIANIINTSLSPLLAEADPLNIGEICGNIYRHQVATHGAGTAVVIGMGGVDIALWDLKGKILN